MLYFIQFLSIPILIFIGLCLLERLLARKNAVWPGLVLPVGLLLFFTLPWLFDLFRPGFSTSPGSLLLSVLISSLPVVILLLVYFVSRKNLDHQKKSRDELRKMDIQDLN